MSFGQYKPVSILPFWVFRIVLHFGEIEATVLALRNNAILLSNDSRVKKEIQRLNLGIEVFNLEDIISTLIDVGELTSENDVKQLIEVIEAKDRVLIRNKGYLLQKVSKG